MDKSIGIDGIKGQWLAVMIEGDDFEVDKFKTIDAVIDKYSDADIILLDMPMGFATEASQLRPDGIVKKLLGKKGSTIFPVPCRQAIYADSKEAARQCNIEVYGKSLSYQSLGLCKAMRQVDTFLSDHPEWKNNIHEAHPEFSFMKLNEGEPLMSKKTEPSGQVERLELLETFFPKSREVLNTYLNAVPNRKKADDVIDALCLAVMGQVIQKNGMKRIPEHPERDLNGIEMKIVYGEVER